jgi:hypothetical protein
MYRQVDDMKLLKSLNKIKDVHEILDSFKKETSEA